MPIHLPPLSRRRFLAGSLAAGAGVLASRFGWAAEATADPNSFILLADTHVGSRMDQEHDGVKPAKTLERAVVEIGELKPRPATAIVAGDCAFLHGEAADYTLFGDLLKPLRQAGMPLHFALGNHDHRDRFLAAFPDAKAHGVQPPVQSKFVSMVETPHANWFLLDSLDKTGTAKGLLGDVQLHWLAKALDARTDKPALVLAHHNPDRLVNIHGLTDTARLFEVLVPRRHVKAYFYGHTHRWQVGRESKVHLVNIPATAWLFEPGEPRGLLTAQLRPDGATVMLHCLDHHHAKHGDKVDLKWRT